MLYIQREVKSDSMDEIELHELTVNERDRYLNHYVHSCPLISDYVYSSLFMWAEFYTLKISYYMDLACIICTGGGFPPSLLMPLGMTENKMKSILDYYYQWFDSRGQEFCISHVEDRFLPLIQSIESYDFSVTYDRNYSDYIYLKPDFINMDGHNYKGLKKKIRSFNNHHQNVEYSKIKTDDISECKELLDTWRTQKGYNADSAETVKLLDNYEELKLLGGAVRINGKLQAFFLGEEFDDTGYIISGKADMDIHGLYIMGVREFVKNEFPGVKYINRCEDLGIETLRDAKLSWMPAKILHKYNVRCSRK